MSNQGGQKRRPLARRQRLFLATYVLGGLIVVAFLFILDSTGIFIYLPYALAYSCALLYGVIGAYQLIAAGIASFNLRASALVVISAAAVMMFAVLLPHLRTSSRKGFWLDAQVLEVGMPTTQAIKSMASYRLFDRYQVSGHLTYSFRANRQTEDHVVLTLSEDGAHVVAVRYSPD